MMHVNCSKGSATAKSHHPLVVGCSTTVTWRSLIQVIVSYRARDMRFKHAEMMPCGQLAKEKSALSAGQVWEKKHCDEPAC